MPCAPKPAVPPCVIIQDTREPSPTEAGAFKPYILGTGKGTKGPAQWALQIERRKLDTGDYSLPGFETMVTLERKSLSDLLGTLFGATSDSVGDGRANLERFRRELDRMRSFKRAAIVVEASMQQVLKGDYRSTVLPQSVLGAVNAIFIDYGVPTIWAGDRSGAEYVIGWTLARIWEQAHEGPAAKKARERGCAEHLPWMVKQ